MPAALFLDIETDFERNITVLGFSSAPTGTIQLVGEEITASRVRRALPRTATLYTFNGHCFDLPVIKTELGLDLRAQFTSIDLRYVCKSFGLTGGQKAIEQRLRYKRKIEGVDGWEAIRLWRAHERGAPGALKKLLAYNREDVAGLEHIQRTLARRRERLAA